MNENRAFREMRAKLDEDFKKAQDNADKKIDKEIKNQDSGESPWPVYDSHLSSYSSWFKYVLPEEGSRFFETKKYNAGVIPRYLNKHFSQRENDLIGVEVGGNGSLFFLEVKKNIPKRPLFKKTVGITLKDFRNPKEQEKDSQNNHFVLEGQVFEGGQLEKNAIAKVLETTGGERPDYIMERMIAGIEDSNLSAEFWYLTLNDWYKFLKPGGVMMVQSCGRFDGLSRQQTNKLINEWADFTNRQRHDVVMRYNSQLQVFLIEKYQEGSLPKPKVLGIKK